MKCDVDVAVIAIFVACTCTITAASTVDGSSLLADDKPSKQQQLWLLTKLLQPVQDLSKQADELSLLIAKAVKQNDINFAAEKRQSGAWDMDYGWGGGRFGKRAEVMDAYGLRKRSNLLRALALSQQDHFNKEQDNKHKKYDMYGVGGRFGRDVDHVDIH